MCDFFKSKDTVAVARECTISELNALRTIRRALEQDPPDIATALERLKYNEECLAEFLLDTK